MEKLALHAILCELSKNGLVCMTFGIFHNGKVLHRCASACDGSTHLNGQTSNHSLAMDKCTASPLYASEYEPEENNIQIDSCARLSMYYF